MAIAHDQGICIRHWDFSETSQTVTLFGRDGGIVRGLAKGARRERGAFDGGIDLLSRGEFGVIRSARKELATLTEWDLLEVFPRLRTDLHANRAAFYMADVLGRMLAPDDPHPALYDRFARSLRALGGAAPGEGPSIDGPAALLAFQWSLLGETGHRPDIDSAAPVGPDVVEYLPEAGSFREPGPGGPAGARWKVRRTTVAQLRACESGLDAECVPGSVERGNRFLAACVRHVLGSEPPTMAPLFGVPAQSSA
jgi:DNA repair protein RecO (recombination protein O)